MLDRRLGIALLLMLAPLSAAPSQSLAEGARENIDYTPHGVSWFREFRDPMYLVADRGTGGVLEFRLVPEQIMYFDPGSGAAREIVGGPYRQRWEIEEDRNRLADEGYPVNLTRVRITDRSGRVAMEFELGRKPRVLRTADGPLEGEVNADFADFGHDYFPLPFDLEDYFRHVRELLRRERMRAEAAEEDEEGEVRSIINTRV